MGFERVKSVFENPDANATNPNAAPQADSGPPRTVEVGASGQVETAPTRAVIRVGVTSRAESVETVRRQLAENASRMRQALQDAGVDPGQIATEDYDIRRDRHPRRERGEREQPRVRGRHAFVITLSNTSRVGQVVVTAVQNGATNVRDVRFTVDRRTRLDLRKQALANAHRSPPTAPASNSRASTPSGPRRSMSTRSTDGKLDSAPELMPVVHLHPPPSRAAPSRSRRKCR